MAHRSQTNELSSWFVRRCVGGGDTKPQPEAAQKQQKGGRGRQTDAAQPAEPPKKPSLPAAAAAAVAAVVHPDRKPKADGTEAADPKKQVQAQQQQQQHKQQQQAQQQQQQQQQQQAQQKQQKQQQKQQAAKPPSGSDSDSDSGSATRRAGRRRRSHDEARSEDEQQHKQQQRSADQEQQAAARQEEEEVDDRPRVLAYSDSDSDVESHFKRFERDVTQHLLPPSEEDAAAQAAAVEAAAAAAKAAEEAAAAAARRSPVRRLGSAAAGVVGAAARHLTPGLAVRAGGLLALQRVHPGVARAASAVSVAVPLAGASATRAGLPLGAMLPRALQAAGRELGQFGQAAVALAVGRVLLGALRQHQRQRRQRRSQGQGAAPAEQVPVAVGQPVATPSGRLLRRKSSVNLAALVGGGDLSASIRQLNPQSSAEWAAVYAAEMREMRRMLQECEVQLPPERFDSSNAELFRFAKACGLTTAKTPEARAAAVEAGFSRVVHSVDWAARHRFMTDRELRRWDRLVAWKAHDASGRPILLARVGRAMQLVKPERYEEFTNALISLVHKGLSSQFSNAPGGAEQMVVVLDCRGGSSVGMTRHMGLLKKFAVTMTQHYPDRLFRLHLLELPLLLRWALHAVTPLLHPATRSKLVTSSINDPQLPVTVAFLSKRRSSYAKSLRRNFSNASFPSSGDSTPALLSPQPSQVGVAAVAAATAAVAAAPAALHAAAAGLPVGYQQQQQQQQGRQEQKDEDVPNTPPPTLKAPQSPHELASQRVVRRLSHERVALHARQHLHPGHAQQASDGKPHHSPHPVRHVALHARANLHNHAHPQQPASPPRHPQQAAASAPAAHVQQEAPPSPFARQAAQQRALSRGPFDAAAALPAVPGNQPQAAAAAAAQPTATLQPAGPAGGKAAAASAAAGPSSHAVPWSPGMQSPSGDLSRDSSFGEELVPAARAIAAAEAVREVDGAASAAGTAAAAGSSALASRRPPPLQHVGSGSSDTLTLTPTPLTTPGPRGLQQQQGSGSTPAAAEASSTTGSGPVGMWGIFAALMPALRSPGGSAITAAAAAEGSEPELLRRRSLLAHRIPSFTSSREPSPVTPYSARRRGGLGDLPEQPRRRTPGRGVTPRKSSLRRTVSASSEDSSRQPLESHPLRRQSSVSWAEELESIKEIQPHPEHASPNGPARWLLRAGLDSPLRQRLTAAAAAAGQQPPSVVLAMTMLLLMVVAMAERLLLSSVA